MSTAESLGAPGCHTPLSLEQIMDDLDGGQYIRTILPTALRDLVSKTGGRGGAGTTSKKRKYSTTGWNARVRVRYNAYLTALYLQDG